MLNPFSYPDNKIFKVKKIKVIISNSPNLWLHHSFFLIPSHLRHIDWTAKAIINEPVFTAGSDEYFTPDQSCVNGLLRRIHSPRINVKPVYNALIVTTLSVRFLIVV